MLSRKIGVCIKNMRMGGGRRVEGKKMKGKEREGKGREGKGREGKEREGRIGGRLERREGKS